MRVSLLESDQTWVTLATLTAMMLSAAAIAIRTADHNPLTRYVEVSVSILIRGGVTLAVMTVEFFKRP